MSLPTVDTGTTPEVSEPDTPKAWNPFTRILFRFFFLYCGLFCVFYPQPLYAFTGPISHWLPDNWFRWWIDLSAPLVRWVGRTVFDTHLALHDTGSGDQAIMWVLVFCILVIAVAGTAVWSVLDRRRREYRRLAGWFLLFIRLCVAGQLMFYGFAKLIPNQMPDPGLVDLLVPYGDFSHMSVLWSQVGISPVYESLLGAAEVTGGLLLLLPRTQLAGVLLGIVSMAQVWILNMTYDVPVKLLSFHLLLLGLVLLAPEAPRLAMFLTGRASGPSTAPQPFRTRRAWRIAAASQVVLAVWFAIPGIWEGVDSYHQYGLGRPKSELYGIWVVTDFSRDGQPVPPLLTDETRWRRVVFDYPQFAFYQKMDDSIAVADAQIDSGAHRLVLSDKTGAAQGTLTYNRPTPDHMVLTGELNDHPVVISLDRTDLSKLPLRRSGGLHLIQEDADFGSVVGE